MSAPFPFENKNKLKCRARLGVEFGSQNCSNLTQKAIVNNRRATLMRVRYIIRGRNLIIPGTYEARFHSANRDSFFGFVLGLANEKLNEKRKKQSRESKRQSGCMNEAGPRARAHNSYLSESSSRKCLEPCADFLIRVEASHEWFFRRKPANHARTHGPSRYLSIAARLEKPSPLLA